MSRPGSMDTLSRVGKLVGLTLVFIGVLVMVVFASIPGNCFSGTNCGYAGGGTNFASQAAWAILAGKALFVVGLAAFAMGGFLKLRALSMPANGKREDTDFVIADRRNNWVLVLLSLVLMFLMLAMTILTTTPPGL
jgi:hypothetical protein